MTFASRSQNPDVAYRWQYMYLRTLPRIPPGFKFFWPFADFLGYLQAIHY